MYNDQNKTLFSHFKLSQMSVLTITVLLESWKWNTLGGSSDNELMLLSLNQQR